MNWPARPEGHTPDKTGRPDEPWWTREAITWLDAHLKPNMSVLEWGTGASTLWLARRVNKVISVEHDKEWARKVDVALCESRLFDVSGGVFCYPLGPAYYDIWVVGGVDVAIIDGRLRVFCCEQATHVLKPGGILVLDNAERKEYAEVHELLQDWPVIRTDNGIWRTDIFTKP